MAYSVTCQKCDETFEVADSARGEKVRCPNCRALQIADNPEQDENKSKETTLRFSRSGPKATGIKPPALPPEDDDPPMRQSKRRNDEDEDRPRQSKRIDDEDDDSPAQARRRRAKDRDDDDDVPARRRPRSSGGRSVVPFLLVGGGGAIMVMMAVIYLVFLRGDPAKQETKKTDQVAAVDHAAPPVVPNVAVKTKSDEPEETVFDFLQTPRTLTGQQVYDRLLKSCAWIVYPQPKGEVEGSGSLVNAENRIVLTNFHVVHVAGVTATEVFVSFPVFGGDGRVNNSPRYYMERMKSSPTRHKAKVFAVDPEHDLALLQVVDLPAGIEQLPLARTGGEPGQAVHSIGNPGRSDSLWVYTSGTVRTSPYQKQWLVKAGGDNFQFRANIIETQSPTNPGDSGGPLVNERGELVAVTQGGAVGANALSYFIDVSEVKGFLKSKGLSWGEGANLQMATTADSQQTRANLGKLATLLTHSSPRVRLRAISLIADAQPRSAETVPALARALNDTTPEIRRIAARVLGDVGPPAAVALTDLVPAIKDTDAQVRSFALQAVLKIGPSGTGLATVLNERLADSDVEVQENALLALGKMGPAAEPALDGIKKLVEGPDNKRRQLALDLMKNMPPNVQAAFLDSKVTAIRLLAAGWLASTGEKAQGVVTPLARALQDPAAEVRAAAAVALGEVGKGAAGALPDLARTLKDKDRQVSVQALKAMHKIGPAGAEFAAPLGQYMAGADAASQKVALECLARLGAGNAEAALPGVLKILESNDATLRRRALDVLETMGPAAEQATPILKKILQAPKVEPEVTTQIARLLSRWNKVEEALTVLMPELIKGLKQDDTKLCLENLKMLEQAGNKAKPAAQAIDDLYRRTLDRDMRLQALRTMSALGEAAEPSVPSLILDLKNINLASKDTPYIDQVCKTLIKIGKPSVKPILKLALYDPLPGYRIKALEIIYEIGRDARADALEPLQTQLRLREKSPDVRNALTVTIEKLK